jgi:hypothetical protein
MSNDAGNFLRKMVKFVANPTTDWAELDVPGVDDKESEYAKAEIKAMIERKRRNDFVRKRELDMLRKIRREGLSHDSALALSSPSNLDSESRSSGGARSDIAVKAKIDEIEQQMVGSGERRHDTRQPQADAQPLPTTRPANLGNAYAPTRPLSETDMGSHAGQAQADLHTAGKTLPKDLSVPLTLDISDEVLNVARSQAPQMPNSSRPAYSPMAPSGFANPFAVDVSEVVHDPDLDESVIAFANADFEQCENSLIQLLQPGGVRHDSADSWLVLFDLYRALDMSQRFEALANAYAHQFAQSAPQWYSLPERVSQHLSHRDKLVDANAAKSGTAATVGSSSSAPATRPSSSVLEGWIAPPVLDVEAIGRLRCEILQLPRPWVMDWVGVESVTAEGANQLYTQLRHWSQDSHDITWIGADHLYDVLAELAPPGVKDSDPAFWMLRLELLRLGNRVDRFDEVAIDYCVTYELSPPSWEPAQCKVRLMEDATCTQTVTLSHIGDVSTSFVESQLHDEIEFVRQASLELAGQLVGDIGDTLAELDQQLGSSEAVQLDCTYLIRVDFIAAGDLLNWVLSRRSENRSITFLNPHRLVALFFGAMGITEHAKVKLLMV